MAKPFERRTGGVAQADTKPDTARVAWEVFQDAGIALLWVVLLIAILVFAGGGSQFIYVDF